jgi:hypothetical protein
VVDVVVFSLRWCRNALTPTECVQIETPTNTQRTNIVF